MARDLDRCHFPTDERLIDRMMQDMPPVYAEKLAGARSLSLPWGESAKRDSKSPEKTWIWIEGDTRECRGVIIAAGGRWSRKRQQYYIPDCDKLPIVLELLGLRGRVMRSRS